MSVKLACADMVMDEEVLVAAFHGERIVNKGVEGVERV